MSEEKIPTEVMEKIREKYPRNTDWNVIDTSNIQRNAAEFGYRLLCEGKDKEITELKAALSDLYLSIVDKSFYSSNANAIKKSKQILNL